MGDARRYRRKPGEVEAVQFTDAPRSIGEIVSFGEGFVSDDTLSNGEIVAQVTTYHGVVTAVRGDWIVRGGPGNYWPVAREVFAATYEPASGPGEREGAGDSLHKRIMFLRDWYGERRDHEFMGSATYHDLRIALSETTGPLTLAAMSAASPAPGATTGVYDDAMSRRVWTMDGATTAALDPASERLGPPESADAFTLDAPPGATSDGCAVCGLTEERAIHTNWHSPIYHVFRPAPGATAALDALYAAASAMERTSFAERFMVARWIRDRADALGTKREPGGPVDCRICPINDECVGHARCPALAMLDRLREVAGATTEGARDEDAPCARHGAAVCEECAHDDGFREGWEAGRRDARGAADAEPELPGTIPEENRRLTVERPEDSLRAAVRATKAGILARIDSLRPPEGESAPPVCPGTGTAPTDFWPMGVSVPTTGLCGICEQTVPLIAAGGPTRGQVLATHSYRPERESAPGGGAAVARSAFMPGGAFCDCGVVEFVVPGPPVARVTVGGCTTLHTITGCRAATAEELSNLK